MQHVVPVLLDKAKRRRMKKKNEHGAHRSRWLRKFFAFLIYELLIIDGFLVAENIFVCFQ